ncbi:MAG: class I SAM-dependent methyltransferase [Firmicutes bacterium]|nr:class I SAM-dependent methyltransferase [Bacillota bacterium]
MKWEKIYVIVIALLICTVAAILFIKNSNRTIPAENVKNTAATAPAGSGDSKNSEDKYFIPQRLTSEQLTRYVSLNQNDWQVFDKMQEKWVLRDWKPEYENCFAILSGYIKPGDTVADIGCGAGWWTFSMSAMTGPSGKVYALDINPLQLMAVNIQTKVMEERYGEGKFINITTRLSHSETLNLPPSTADVCFMADVHLFNEDMENTGKPDWEEKRSGFIRKNGEEAWQKQLQKQIASSETVFLKSIVKAMKPNACFILYEEIDNESELNAKMVGEFFAANNLKLVEDASKANYQMLVFRKTE